MLDSEALADLIAELVGDHVERATAPLLTRIAQLEAKEPVAQPGIAGERGTDGRDGADGVNGRDGIDGQDGAPGADGRDGVDGRDGRDGQGIDDISCAVGEDAFELRFARGDVTDIFEIPLLAGKDGQDGRDGVDGAAGRDGMDGERGPEGPAGKMPVAKTWEDRVHREGEVIAHLGATWQATRDTGKEPPHEDWILLARAGADGRSFRVAETYDAAKEYSALDVVALNGGSFVARADNPGPCPGDGWQLLASRGKAGPQGERGAPGTPGARGEAGQPVVAAKLDENGMLTLVNGDGSTVNCDFYPLLERITRSR